MRAMTAVAMVLVPVSLWAAVAEGADGPEVQLAQSPEVVEPKPLPRFRDRRSDYVQDVRDQVLEFERHADEMRVQLNVGTNGPNPQFRRAEAAFEARAQEVLGKLREVETADVDTWEERRPDVDAAVAAMEAAYGRLLEQFP